MTDSEPETVDMAAFFARHDRTTRRNFLVMLFASLFLSAVNYLNAASLGEVHAVAGSSLWIPVFQGPFSIAALWIASALYDRRRPRSQPGGRFPMNPDDARNVRRVARAGVVFVTGFGLVMIAGQLAWLLWSLGAVPDLEAWGLRPMLVAVGLLAAYFGNVSPRLPIPRVAAAKPAVRMRYNRLGGWFTVILGSLLAAAGLFLPFAQLIPAIAVLSLATLALVAVSSLLYWAALKAPAS